MNKSKIIFWSVVDSLGVLAYVLLLMSFFMKVPKLVNQPPGVLGSAVILLIFVFSATVVGLLVLGRPGHLYFNGFKKEGLTLLFLTLACLLVFAVIILAVIVVIK